MPLPSQEAIGGTGADPLLLSRRRRPPNYLEQMRRKAWGRLWGSANSQAGHLVRKER